MDFGVHGSNNIKSPLSVRQTVTSGGIGTLDDPITEITNASTGILYKNDGQTYCEVAITSQNFGIAAASCFDYAGGNVDLSVKYFVMMSSNTQIAAFGTYAVQVVTPHPNYNPTTYANNIAVLKLTTVPGFSFTQAMLIGLLGGLSKHAIQNTIILLFLKYE
ncbi:hypothetical protein BX070DRAFT_246931 [Coemansia spiralis]|nr:hypothetical protein BX070DRAFT_246931 [Coemansia spiralis]